MILFIKSVFSMRSSVSDDELSQAGIDTASSKLQTDPGSTLQLPICSHIPFIFSFSFRVLQQVTF